MDDSDLRNGQNRRRDQNAYAIQVKFEETRARCTSHIMPSAAPQSTVITKNSVE